MPGGRFFLSMRWLLAAAQLLLLVVPTGLAGSWSVQHCLCGMERGHCTCNLNQAGRGGHCGMKGAMPDRCSLRSPEPVEGRTSPVGPELPDRLGIVRCYGPGVDPTPRGIVLGLVVLPPLALAAPPDTPPPRGSFRIG